MDIISYLLGKKAGSGGGSGTEVIANPELAGTEAELTGLQVGDTKYKVENGGIEILSSGTVDISTLDNGLYMTSNISLQYRNNGDTFSAQRGFLFVQDNEAGSSVKSYVFYKCYGIDGSADLTIHYGNTGGKDATHYTYSIPGTSA